MRRRCGEEEERSRRCFNNWLRERYDMKGLQLFADGKTVPVHGLDFSYYTGGIVLFLFVLQFVTGMALALYYVPHPEFAQKSIIDIVTKQNMGWFFRSLHHWGAQCAIAALFIHFFTTLLLKSYRKPREFTWLSGFALFAIGIFFGLSGYLLLWDERAFAAVRVATGGAGSVPFIGPLIKGFLRGGIDVTGETLTRFYAFHVVLLPVISLFLVAVHIVFVQHHGMSVPLSQEKKNRLSVPFFPDVILKDIIIWLLALGLVVTLSALLPPQICVKADPLAPAPENIRPEWYFLALFQTFKLFPGSIMGFNGETIAICLVICAIVFLCLIPFFDVKSSKGLRSPVFTGAATGYLLYFLIMTTVAATVHPQPPDTRQFATGPSAPFDRYTLYISLIIFWALITGLVVIICMKLKELKKTLEMNLSQKIDDIPFLD